MFEQVHTNEITRHWFAKNPKEFWKVWHKKFGKRIDANALPAWLSILSFRATDYTEQFASHFEAVYYPSVDDSATVDEFCISTKITLPVMVRQLMLINFVQRFQLN